MGIKLDATKLILVEGSSDKAFFEALLKNRRIKGFEVYSPWDLEPRLAGEDAIKDLLYEITVPRSFDNVKKILVVVDSDDSPIKKFKKFQKVIRNIAAFSGRAEKYPVPSTLGIFASATDCPDVAILLLPNNTTTGAMETLCLQAALPNYPAVVPCIDNFATCIAANAWSPQKSSKLKLRALISSQHPKNPDLPTTKLWEVSPNIVPLDSVVFNELANFLASI